MDAEYQFANWRRSPALLHVALVSTPNLMLTVGICGAFTTFSTFSADSIRLMDNGEWLTVLLYLTISIVGGFLLFYLGRKWV